MNGVTTNLKLNKMAGNLAKMNQADREEAQDANLDAIDAAIGSGGGSIRLDQVLDPTADKAFALGGHSLSFTDSVGTSVGSFIAGTSLSLGSTLATPEIVITPGVVTLPAGTATFGSGSGFNWTFDVGGGVTPVVSWGASLSLNIFNVDANNDSEFVVNSNWNGTAAAGNVNGTIAISAIFNSGTYSITSIQGFQDLPIFSGTGATIGIYSSFGIAPGSTATPPAEFRVFDAAEQSGSTAITAATRRDFYSNLASGSGQWAFYAAGSAASYFGGSVEIEGAIGFFATAPAAKRTVVGVKGDAVAASILAALVAYGLVADGTAT